MALLATMLAVPAGQFRRTAREFRLEPHVRVERSSCATRSRVDRRRDGRYRRPFVHGYGHGYGYGYRYGADRAAADGAEAGHGKALRLEAAQRSRAT